MLRKSVVVLLVGMSLYAVAWATKGTGIPGVDVVLKKKPGGKPSDNTQTDSRGTYTFTGVEPGTYSIAIEEEGLKDKKKPAGGSNARSPAPVSIPATLTRAPGGGTEVTFAGQDYELSVVGQGVTVSEGKANQTISGVTIIEVNLNVAAGGTTITGVFARVAKPVNPNGPRPDKQNN